MPRIHAASLCVSPPVRYLHVVTYTPRAPASTYVVNSSHLRDLVRDIEHEASRRSLSNEDDEIHEHVS